MKACKLAIGLVGVLALQASAVEIGLWITGEVVQGPNGNDQLDYRVGVILSEGDNQGLHLLGYDVLTDTGVTQPLLQLADGEFDGFDVSGDLWGSFKGVPFFNGGWGFNNADLPTGGSQVDDDVLGAGSSWGLQWDADVNDNPADGYQPAKRPGVGQGVFTGWNGDGGPFDDDSTWPPGDFDGQVIRDGLWVLQTGTILIEDEAGNPIAPGSYRVDWNILTASVIRPEANLLEDAPSGAITRQLNSDLGDLFFNSHATFDVVLGGQGGARIVNLNITNDIPEPATMSLLALGSVALLRRRWG